MREADLPALGELYQELDLAGYGGHASGLRELRAAFRSIARNRDHYILVAELDGDIVGTLHVLIFRHLGHGLRPAAVVENVVVRSGLRSRGIGERMLEAARAIAKAERCYKIALTSNIKRPRAHRFYERLGWQRTHFGYSV
ncbi:MAG: GNAT family N-acetyltransferase [Candidatus Binataceae bacterium]